MNWDSRLLKNVDFTALILIAILIAIGLPVIASAIHAPGNPMAGLPLRQALAAGAGFVCMALLAMVDYNEFPGVARFLYYLNLVMLALVRVPGIEKPAKGAYRWIGIGAFTMQPSEPAKVIMLITLANYLAHLMRDRERLDQWADLVGPALHVLPAVALVMGLQSDLGTSLVFIVMLGAMLYMAGFPGIRLIGMVALVVALVGGLLYANINWHVKIPLLQGYQLKRLTTFVNPEADPGGDGWQVYQGRIAVGTGGLWGKGLGKGTLNKNGFVAERHTDWIFSVVGEEMGFVGGLVIVLLYMLLMMRFAIIALSAKDQFGMLLATGVTAMLGFHVFENIGMVLGVMPVAGIPLPFISYGPSAMLTNLAAVGLALNVYMRRHTIMF